MILFEGYFCSYDRLVIKGVEAAKNDAEISAP